MGTVLIEIVDDSEKILSLILSADKSADGRKYEIINKTKGIFLDGYI